MRILFISNLYPPYALGGWEQNCQEIASCLSEREHSCHILTSHFGVKSLAAPEDGVTRTLHLQADIYHYRPLDFFLRRPAQERANRRALRQVLDAFQPDVVFIWGMWNLSTQVAYWAEQWMPGKVAYAVASYWLIEPDVHEAYWRQCARRSWNRILMAPATWFALRILAKARKTYPLTLKNVACVSNYVRRKLSKAGALPYGASVIYNGVDPQPFLDVAEKQSPRRDGMRLVYTGGILPHKGVHTAIEALGLLKQRGEVDGLSLLLVGGGHPDYEAQLRARVSELDLDELVTFYGRVPRNEIPGILATADVFLFTSIWEEPIARSVMEAMAAGLTVVGTSVGGQSEMLIDGTNSLVFAPDEADQLSECILQLYHNAALRLRLANAGQQTVLDRFTIKRMTDELESFLQQIV